MGTVSSNHPFVHQSHRVIKFSMYGQGGRKLEINVPLQQIYANSKGGVIIEGGVMSSECGNTSNNLM